MGILGLGYVGLPLAELFARKGFSVIGMDPSEEKIQKLRSGQNYISDVSTESLNALVRGGKLTPSSSFSDIARCQVVIICVPTPLDRFKKPDMAYIRRAAEHIGHFMQAGTLVSLESTTYPTTTEEFLLPILLENSKGKHGEDFWVCFSPERVDPGNRQYHTENIPKVIGGLGEDAQKLATALYGKVIDEICPVSSPRTAEMVKILENTYRLVNISLINEMALLCGKMGINIWEVIDAAKTKPYGFQAFYPGPGVGGHCIPLDPFYLEYIAKNFNFDLTMIHTAGHIDNLMPHRMLIKINTALNRHKKSVNGSRILFLGVAYKADIDDERESPALKLIDEVAKKGADVVYHDPYVSHIQTPESRRLEGAPLTDTLIDSADCVVFTTNHSVFDVKAIVERARLIVDLRNAVRFPSDKVYKL